jgi:hypothetical protein
LQKESTKIFSGFISLWRTLAEHMKLTAHKIL